MSEVDFPPTDRAALITDDTGWPRSLDMKFKSKITTEQWARARAAVDTESLFALPDRIGCPGCVDEPVDWITVEYSDGTTKSVVCNSGGPAADMADKIKTALALSPRKGQTKP